MRYLPVLLSLFGFVLGVYAQDDDMYFTPKKNKQKTSNTTHQIEVIYETEPSGDDVQTVTAAITNNDRDVDEYNRRGRYKPATATVADTISDYSGEERISSTRTAMVSAQNIYELGYLDGYSQGFSDGDDLDYYYALRLSRFHGCHYYDPWYWNSYTYAHDPWYYDPWYYGSWHSPYYHNTWHNPYYYGGWYSPYHHHHHYPYYPSYHHPHNPPHHSGGNRPHYSTSRNRNYSSVRTDGHRPNASSGSIHRDADTFRGSINSQSTHRSTGNFARPTNVNGSRGNTTTGRPTGNVTSRPTGNYTNRNSSSRISSTSSYPSRGSSYGNGGNHGSSGGVRSGGGNTQRGVGRGR